jgi:hypothetical protein
MFRLCCLVLATSVSADESILPGDEHPGEHKADPVAIMKTLDTNGDGKLSLEELSSSYLKQAGHNWKETSHSREMAFEAADTNKDGSLSKGELQAPKEFKGR